MTLWRPLRDGPKSGEQEKWLEITTRGIRRCGKGWVWLVCCLYSQVNSIMASSNLISRPDWAVAEVSRVTRPFKSTPRHMCPRESGRLTWGYIASLELRFPASVQGPSQHQLLFQYLAVVKRYFLFSSRQKKLTQKGRQWLLVFCQRKWACGCDQVKCTRKPSKHFSVPFMVYFVELYCHK